MGRKSRTSQRGHGSIANLPHLLARARDRDMARASGSLYNIFMKCVWMYMREKDRHLVLSNCSRAAESALRCFVQQRLPAEAIRGVAGGVTGDTVAYSIDE